MASTAIILNSKTHSRLVSLIALLFVPVYFFLPFSITNPLATAIICFAGIVLIGLPHGGLDHLVGQRLVERIYANTPRWSFYLLYLMVGGTVVIGWFVAPLTVVLSFFAFSSWHFGLEDEDENPRTWMQSFGSFTRGGMVIWLPCLFQPDRVVELLAITIPVSQASVAETSVIWIANLWPLWLSMTLVDVLRYKDLKKTSNQPDLRPCWTRVLRISAFGILFATVDPLIGFTIYFCGWHSIRGLEELKRDFADNWPALIKQLLPMSIAATGTFLIALLLWSMQVGLVNAAIRTSFIGLSAVAIPHLLLHLLDKIIPASATSVAHAFPAGGHP